MKYTIDLDAGTLTNWRTDKEEDCDVMDLLTAIRLMSFGAKVYARDPEPRKNWDGVMLAALKAEAER